MMMIMMIDGLIVKNNNRIEKNIRRYSHPTMS